MAICVFEAVKTTVSTGNVIMLLFRDWNNGIFFKFVPENIGFDPVQNFPKTVQNLKKRINRREEQEFLL